MIEMPKELKMWNVDALVPYEKNSRKHSPEQVERIARSIEEFGFTNPILVDGASGIIAGHGRLMAARSLGLSEVPVIQLEHLSEAQKRAYVIADNRLAELSEWDVDILKSELFELAELDFDVTLTGFDIPQLEDDVPERGGTSDEDDVPGVTETPTVKHGDVWILGNHRLRGGDSTKAEDVANLMQGHKADLVFTDPPYNIASHVKNHAVQELRKDSYGRLANSEWDKNFDICKVFPQIENHVAKDCAVYVCTSHFLLPAITQWMSESFDYSNVCIWSKPNPMPSLAKRHWCWSHEFVAYATNGKHVFNYPSEGNAKSVWELKKIPKAEFHPTQKPVEIPEHAILHSSNEGQSVLDLFGGSGSTLIACEKTNRRCFIMELDPKYCDVIVKRWQDYTGRDAIHAETGETFNSLSNGLRQF